MSHPHRVKEARQVVPRYHASHDRFFLQTNNNIKSWAQPLVGTRSFQKGTSRSGQATILGL